MSGVLSAMVGGERDAVECQLRAPAKEITEKWWIMSAVLSDAG